MGAIRFKKNSTIFFYFEQGRKCAANEENLGSIARDDDFRWIVSNIFVIFAHDVAERRMSCPMKILLVDVSSPIALAMNALGHATEELRPPRGLVSLSRLLKQLADRGFVPDLLVQQESLGQRLYLTGLKNAPCPTIFFAIDSHLNLFWHQWYGRLFDAVLTPHLSLFEALPADCALPSVTRMAWFGQARQWRSHESRARFMGLCARRTEHRPLRENFILLLEPRGLKCVEGLDNAAMMALYDDSRLVPNECIAWESNFRLLEAASAGCCVLTPDVGEDQNALLEPGKECLVWHDGLDLLDHVAWAKMRPTPVEKIGRAAFARINACHLPEHRARALLDTARGLPRNRLDGLAARLALWLTAAKQSRNGTFPLNIAEHATVGLHLLEAASAPENLSADARSLVFHSLAQCILLLAVSPKTTPEAMTLARALAAGQFGTQSAEHIETASVASALALREGDFSLARFFWMRCPDCRHANGAGQHIQNIPNDAAQLCCRWAAALRRSGRTAQVGFCFQPDKGALPECALEYLHFAKSFLPAGEEGDRTRKHILVLERDMTALPVHLGRHMHTLDALCALEPGNWRLRLSYGMTCIKACLAEEGVCLIAEARRTAQAVGQEQRFTALLRGQGCSVEALL